MSIRVVRCASCDKELVYEFGEKSYAITETLHKKPCEKCYHDLSEKKWYYFCNSSCLVEWIKKKGWL